MTERILCVDDDPNVLQAYRRTLRKQFLLDCAEGPEEALEAVNQHGPYAVVVSDMRMPGMNGVELLAEVRRRAPQTVRMMLTGNADLDTALQAVNEGHIFRFLTKPCPPEVFAKALEAGLEQYRLVTAEKELLSKTLSGSIKVLTDVLALVNPTAFGRASRVRRLVGQLCRQLGVEQSWMIEIAAMLSQLGCVAVPSEILEKIYRGEPLSRSEAEAFASHPGLARELIQNIPRLQGVAEIVAFQEKRFDGGGPPESDLAGEAIPLGSRILKVALDFDTRTAAGNSPEIALAQLNDCDGWYDPAVLAALAAVLEVSEIYVIRTVRVSELRDGMILADDVRSIYGTLLCAKGQEVTASMRARLKNYVANVGLQAPIRVLVPKENAHQVPAE